MVRRGTLRPMPDAVVQVFGTPDLQATRAAQRFFRERRLEVHLVDVRRKPLAPAELRRFVDRLGARAVADEDSRRGATRASATCACPTRSSPSACSPTSASRLPLVRVGNGVAAGSDEAAWKALLAAPA